MEPVLHVLATKDVPEEFTHDPRVWLVIVFLKIVPRLIGDTMNSFRSRL